MYTKEQIEFAKVTGTYNQLYADTIKGYIRTRYSLEDEIAILRQKDEKPEEYQEWYKFAEHCKELAKAKLEGGNEN